MLTRPVWLLVLLYAAFSILWMSVASYLIALTLDDPILRSQAYFIKELVLVIASSGLFYALLKFVRDTVVPPSIPSPDSVRFQLNRLMLMFVSLAMVAPLVSVGIVKVYGPEMERRMYDDLHTIADLKAEQIELWLEERSGDAEVLAASQAFIERVSNLQQTGGESHQQLIRNRLEAIIKAYSYESALLLDPTGHTLLALGEQQGSPEVSEALRAAALRSGQAQSSDFFLDKNGQARLDIVVPLVSETPNPHTVALVVLRANLAKFLLPLAEKWPGSSSSAEILLIRREDGTVHYLNRGHGLNHPSRPGEIELSTLNGLSGTIDTRKLPHGETSGLDYRGEQVLAAYRPISGSNWHLIAKIDQREGLTQLWTLVFWVSVVVLLAITAVSVVLLRLWRQQRRAHQLALAIHTAEQDRLLKYFYELPFIGMAITSPDNRRWLRFNNRLCEILGYSREELAEKDWLEMTHPEDAEKDVAEFERVMRSESDGYAMNKRFIRKDGTIVMANLDVKCVRRDDGRVHYFVAMVRDVTEQENQKAEILAARSQLQATLDAIPDLLFELDLEGRCHAYHSARTGFPALRAEELLGKKISEVLSQAANEVIVSALVDATKQGLSSGKELELHFAQGTFWYELSVSRKSVDPGMAPRFIVLARDITERKAAERRILNLAHFDALTGLPNRALLSDRMKVAIKRAARVLGRIAVLFVDLDRFKPINDSLGHEIGDHLLQVVAERMQTAIRSVDTVSRVGGDEFVVLLGEIDTTEDAARVAEKLIFTLSRPYHIQEHELSLTASVGICVYPDNGAEPGILIRNADASMYAAKQSGRNRYQFYSDDMTARALERLSLERDLRGAVERGEMFLVYQPQIELETGHVIGAEVLLRWCHATQGLIPPQRFIPVAEDSGMILGIGEWALDQACQQARLWRDRRVLDVSISVNVSAVQFRQTDFVNIVRRALEKSGLPPDRLELELTESVVMQGVEPALEKLRQLAALGVKVAIDDFGTGYSSLAYLRQFTVDRLKIDQSFVHDLPGNTDAEAIATAIVAMGNSLGFRIIAEGVETKAQAEFLQSVLCKEGQGYLYAWPMTASEFEQWVVTWKPRPAGP
jgi:diguanylate cyclase (GGDEF)-like protein/PAS domain S-box-containing protein